jgi:hypothetical protein
METHEELNGGEAPKDILEDGENVSHVSDRNLILRAVNASLVAKAVSEKVDDLATEIHGLRAAVETLMRMIGARTPV